MDGGHGYVRLLLGEEGMYAVGLCCVVRDFGYEYFLLSLNWL